VDLLALIGRDTPLRRTGAKHGGEYSGPCPLCRLGTDRFKVWPALGRWACLGRSAGRAGCDRSGDAVQYLREHDGLRYSEACERLGQPPTPSPHPYAPQMISVSVAAPLRPPCPVWQQHAAEWVAFCQTQLAGTAGARARAWLERRGLDAATIADAGIGYNPRERYEARALWGLPPANGSCARSVWLPRGIVLPWHVEGALWRVNVRRPLAPWQSAAGQAKYVGPAGCANALYGADDLAAQRPSVLVEGEIDALTVRQCAGDLVAAVATGSTGGARRAAWVMRLSLAPAVLVAFDADPNGAGDQAAAWWLSVLANSRRLRPVGGKDVNAMHTAGIDVRAWVLAGLA